MLKFFEGAAGMHYAVEIKKNLSAENAKKLEWLFGNAKQIADDLVQGMFVGPRKEMITPWSTNAVEITQNMGIDGIFRIEQFVKSNSETPQHDPMLQRVYTALEQTLFTIEIEPESIIEIDDIQTYNKNEGLALSQEEVNYLEELSKKLDRKLTDSEVYGFAQVNSEHCRHKIFNGEFVIEGETMPDSLFKLIRKTSEEHPNRLVSAYKDNVAFVQGPKIEQFAPASHDKPDFFETRDINSIISLKAETHNFPTTVEPFNGAATGTGGEIRDRLAGGKGSLPLAGTAVYMTSYSRLEENREWENATEERPWLYQTPMNILIKASNGASDFGNKFGQPLICGSVLTFEHFENDKKFGFDKVIMLAGGVGFGKAEEAEKDVPAVGDKVVLLGGDNYRIGMGGGAVSSVDTGEFSNSIELNAVQRSNPEMQKRAMNAIRALVESEKNPTVSIHDHGAGGHLNCLSELVEETGGTIYVDQLPVGDPTLSSKEIVGNESQERMGLVMKPEDIENLQRVADRERSPMHVVGETTGDKHFKFEDRKAKTAPIDLELEAFFGKPPKTVLTDKDEQEKFTGVEYNPDELDNNLKKVLQLESVACKDWLTNKVDRSVTGKVAQQQCIGALQLPLSNVAVMALDYKGQRGVATAIGHSPVSALVDPVAGSRNSIAEALTNLVWTPIADRLAGVSLSANWMWPAKNNGENARLYKAVKGVSDFAIELGINIPTGKDSLSMTQKYDNDVVYSPGTVIISSVGEAENINQVVTPVLKNDPSLGVYYIDFSNDSFKLGGSSFAQAVNKLGYEVPSVTDSAYFAKAFNTIQNLIADNLIAAGHDISAGGLVTALLEMTFAENHLGLDVDITKLGEADTTKVLFAENAGILVQASNNKEVERALTAAGLRYFHIGNATTAPQVQLKNGDEFFSFDIAKLRDTWFRTSYLLDRKQSSELLAKVRFLSYKENELKYKFPKSFTGKLSDYGIDQNRKTKSGVRAAIIREKGVNGDREMAYSMHLAGFDVKDVHMTDLIAGRETLEDVNFIVYVGGFSNSDVLGSAKGWAGAFLYNPKAKKALDNFYARKDTLSLGVCNGCQLMMELGLITPDHNEKPQMLHNDSHKFESGFVNMEIPENDSVLFNSLGGTRLGVWVAHGEGKFNFPYAENEYNIIGKYGYKNYPANPNGSDFNAAGIASSDGRHLAMMPHLERAIFQWNWPHYPENRQDEVSPWIEAFVNARNWIQEFKK